jgi:HD-GYP domain-containing protein (c-di-GMP phosphodiesterase class II)
VGLTDVYNALVSSRHHRDAYKVEEALEYLFAAGNYDFDHNLVQLFLRHLNIYPVSTHVLLSTGQSAYVVETAGRPLLRPVVQVYREADGSSIPSPFLLDLDKTPHISILKKLN